MAKEKKDLMTRGQNWERPSKNAKRAHSFIFCYQHWKFQSETFYTVDLFHFIIAWYFPNPFASNDEFKSSTILSMLQFLVFLSFLMCIFNIVLVEYMHFFIISFTSFAMKNKRATQYKKKTNSHTMFNGNHYSSH